MTECRHINQRTTPYRETDGTGMEQMAVPLWVHTDPSLTDCARRCHCGFTLTLHWLIVQADPSLADCALRVHTDPSLTVQGGATVGSH